MNILGLDIGGANIKVATADGESASVPFEIWKAPQQLTSALMAIPLCRRQPYSLIALTMTAELADCFETKAAGVADVIASVHRAFPEAPLRIWLTSSEFAEPDDAVDLWPLVAAANWHALATWASRAVPAGPSLLIDVGSTTTDIIPLLDGQPIAEGSTDATRLAASELLYTGSQRTPVCAMVRSVPIPSDWRGPVPASGEIPLAAELFATSLDVHLVTGDIADDDTNRQTADGRPASRDAAQNRLARMLCCDREELTDVQLTEIAEFIAASQLLEIANAVRNRAAYLRTQSPIGSSDLSLPVLIAGSGAWLAEKALTEVTDVRFDPIINLSTMFDHNISPVAAAFAVARLAAERCLHDLLPLIQLHGVST